MQNNIYFEGSLSNLSYFFAIKITLMDIIYHYIIHRQM